MRRKRERLKEKRNPKIERKRKKESPKERERERAENTHRGRRPRVQHDHQVPVQAPRHEQRRLAALARPLLHDRAAVVGRLGWVEPRHRPEDALGEVQGPRGRQAQPLQGAAPPDERGEEGEDDSSQDVGRGRGEQGGDDRGGRGRGRGHFFGLGWEEASNQKKKELVASTEDSSNVSVARLSRPREETRRRQRPAMPLLLSGTGSAGAGDCAAHGGRSESEGRRFSPRRRGGTGRGVARRLMDASEKKGQVF